MDKTTGAAVDGGLLQLEPRVGGLRARVTPYSSEVSYLPFLLSSHHGAERDKFVSVSISTRCSRSFSRSLPSGSTIPPPQLHGAHQLPHTWSYSTVWLTSHDHAADGHVLVEGLRADAAAPRGCRVADRVFHGDQGLLCLVPSSHSQASHY